MFRLIILLFITFLSSCSTMNPKLLVCPSEHLYCQANDLYEVKNYQTAIDKYKLFLDRYPQSELTTSVKLNLAMSYYYLNNCDDAYKILKSLNIQDKNLKSFLDKIISECEGKISIDKPTGTINTDNIIITITDAYLDDSDTLFIKGNVSEKSQVTVNGVSAAIKDNNEFTAITSWKKGTGVEIVARINGNETKLNYFPDSEEPKKPTNIRTINTTTNSINLEWDKNDEEDIKGYKLYYRLKNGGQQEVSEIIKKTDYEIIGLQRLVDGTNKTFQFYLRAIDKMGNYSNPSDIFEATLP